MKKLTLCFVLASFASVFASDTIMPVSEIKPGMTGVGRTVFAGDKIEEFGFEVLDILPNFRSKRDLIIVKLLGEKVQYTNVVAGMSGSPMYIEGKLVGALAYRMGVFLKDPIAGITPIEEMLEILAKEEIRGKELALNRGFNPDYLEMAVGTREITLESLVPPALSQREHSAAASEISRLHLPLFFSGFETNTVEMASHLFGQAGFEIHSIGGEVVSSLENTGKPLSPGSAYSVVLVDGDLGLQTTGTVTYAKDGNVIGMGHPFLNYGAVGLPMARSKIVTTISSLMASTKMSGLTEIIGTVHQDRTAGVMGVEGEAPKMIPVKLDVTTSLGETTEFKFRVAEDRSLNSLTPLVFSIVLSNALESARMSVGNQTLRLTGLINLKDQKPLPIENYYAGSPETSFITDGMQATGEVAATIGALLSNSYQSSDIESVQLSFEALPQKKLAFIQRLVTDKTVVRPGEKVRVTAYLKEYQGEVHKISESLTVPENLNVRRIGVFAGSGETLTRVEARSTPQRFQPNSFEKLVELLNARRKNNFVFFQIRQPDQGVMVDGAELPGLPPSVLSVIRAQKSSGNIVALRDRVLIEMQIETEYAVSGGRSLMLTVESKN